MRATSAVAIVAVVFGVIVQGLHAQSKGTPRVPAVANTTPRSSGVFTIGGTPHPYLIEGEGVTCIVTGLAPFFPPLFF